MPFPKTTSVDVRKRYGFGVETTHPTLKISLPRPLPPIKGRETGSLAPSTRLEGRAVESPAVGVPPQACQRKVRRLVIETSSSPSGYQGRFANRPRAKSKSVVQAYSRTQRTLDTFSVPSVPCGSWKPRFIFFRTSVSKRNRYSGSRPPL